MVILMVLDGDEEAADPPSRSHLSKFISPRQSLSGDDGEELQERQHERPNPNINSFSAALSCYPVVSQIASHLDLNSLHDLSAACRQFQANLLQFRNQLVKQALRCSNEPTSIGVRLADCLRESRFAWEDYAPRQSWNGRKITSGRVGNCARDMVRECRRCGVVVCRNCTAKPPPKGAAYGRHRRLCRTCMKSPLQLHTSPFSDREDKLAPPTFTSDAFNRNPCNCPDIVYLCKPCGSTLRTNDTTYMRGWTWRTRYSTYLGGLGTGIGEGNEGVECGRGEVCLAAREVEKEIDCDAAELADLKRSIEEVEKQGRRWGGTSYLTQEIEGIGGVVKKKVKKRVRVGAVVKEYEDERETGDYLEREQRGKNRSWCAWCARVVLGHADRIVERDGQDFQLTTSGSSSDRSLRI